MTNPPTTTQQNVSKARCSNGYFQSLIYRLSIILLQHIGQEFATWAWHPGLEAQ